MLHDYHSYRSRALLWLISGCQAPPPLGLTKADVGPNESPATADVGECQLLRLPVLSGSDQLLRQCEYLLWMEGRAKGYRLHYQ